MKKIGKVFSFFGWRATLGVALWVFWAAELNFRGALGYPGGLIRLTIRWEGYIIGFKDKNVRGRLT